MRATRQRLSRYELTGTISNVAFSSGHRFVVGHWKSSPVGPLNDVMWAQPDGTRILLVDRHEAGAFITAIYHFDAVTITQISWASHDSVINVVAGDVRLVLRLGRRWPIPLAALRRVPLVRPVEQAAARALLGVRTYGVSPTGVREWYRADRYQPIRSADGWIRDHHLGRLVPFHAPARFGFSEPPRRPAVVGVRPRLDDPHDRIRSALALSRRRDRG